jgi:multiple sugar transport system substrate-binding protein
LIQKDNIDKSRFQPGGIEPAYDGKVYGFSHDTAYWLLFYNKDLFDKAGVAYPPASGWTMDQFIDTACKLSKPADGQWGMHNLNWLTGILAKQQGFPYLEMVNGVPQYRLDDPKTLAWYQRVADFINKDNCQPNADQNSSLGGADPFLAGKAAMQFNGNWGFGSMKDKATFKWGVAPLPGLKQPNVGMKVGIVKTSKNQDAAWTFLKWLTYEPEATRFRSEHGMGQPALNDDQAIKTFLGGPTSPQGLDNIVKVLSQPENSFDWPTYPGQSEADNIINPESDAVMQGLNPATEVIPPAVEKANKVLETEWKKVAAK